MRWSIRYQLLIPLLTLLLGVVGMSVWAAVASAHQAREQIENQVRDIAHTVHDFGFPLKENVLQLMKGFSGADYVLITRDDQVRATLPVRANDLPAPELEGHDWDRISLEHAVEVEGTSYLCSGLVLRREPNAGAVLYILYPESRWRDAMWQAVRPSLLFGILGGLAAIGLTVVLAQRLTQRVQELDRRTRLIAEGDFSPMPLPGRNDELRDLTRSVNDMAQRLAHYQDTVQKNERLRLLGQVSGGLAHQLRNGVTGARLAVQVHAAECNGHGDAESLDVALRQLALVEMHLRRFLHLGRAGPQERQTCNVAALLRDTAALLRPQCQHAHIELRLALPEPDTAATVTGDPGQLNQVFLNIMTNAIEAAGPHGWVEVELKATDAGRAQVNVSDSGPGPDAEVAARLFEPFVTGKPDGVGLGLAVAKEIIEAHAGTLRWRRDADRTCFTIELPLEQSP